MSGGPLRVLLITSDRIEAGRLRATVAQRALSTLELLHEPQLARALERLADDRFDAVLLVISGAHARPMEPISRVHDRAPDVPIVVLTDSDDELQAVQALKAGAQDSLVRSQVDGNLLVRAIRYAIERHQLQMALRAMSLVDDLTGLYNRRGFLTLARQQLKVADRMRKRVAQIFVDLDGLKRINDTLGHRDGDQALLDTADLLKETFRDSDIIARIGGDEFVVLAMETSGITAETWLCRMQERLQALNRGGTRGYRLSLSIGVAYYDPEFPCAIDELLAQADTQMYREKRSKRTPSAGAAQIEERVSAVGFWPRVD
ncbi:MAG: diguanylate cyclase [Gemmatimonadaceae bacterium]